MLSENKNAREFGRIDRPVQRAFRTGECHECVHLTYAMTTAANRLTSVYPARSMAFYDECDEWIGFCYLVIACGLRIGQQVNPSGLPSITTPERNLRS